MQQVLTNKLKELYRKYVRGVDENMCEKLRLGNEAIPQNVGNFVDNLVDFQRISE